MIIPLNLPCPTPNPLRFQMKVNQRLFILILQLIYENTKNSLHMQQMQQILHTFPFPRIYKLFPAVTETISTTRKNYFHDPQKLFSRLSQPKKKKHKLSVKTFVYDKYFSYLYRIKTMRLKQIMQRADNHQLLYIPPKMAVPTFR